MDDPRTGEVLPHEVWCKMCSKWVKLYRDVQYIESNWLRHAEKCYLRALANGCVIFSELPAGPWLKILLAAILKFRI